MAKLIQVKRRRDSEEQALPYPCKEVLELYGTQKKEIDSLEKLSLAFIKAGIVAEMYYSNKGALSYATLVIFLPWTFHVEHSKFDLKTFKKWHLKKRKTQNRSQKSKRK
jgi:hypothetical protein